MRRTVLALLVAAGVAAGAGPAGAQASITATGWWSQRPGAAQQPAGGFEVALQPQGPVSIAAVRVQGTASSALLVLTEGEQVLGETARLQACPSADAWTPANPGAWADAPQGQCDKSSVPFGRGSDGTWSADVAALVASGAPTIVIAPVSEVSDAEQSFTFQITFTGARLVAPGAEQSSAPPPDDSPGAQDPAPDPSFAPAYPAPAAPFVPAPAVPAPAAAAQPGQGPAPEVTADAALAVSAQDDTTTDRPWWRLLLGVPISLAVGAGAVLLRQRLRDVA